MKKDILNRRDIETLVDTFYEKVKNDSVIGYYFTKVIPVNWKKHLPVMYDFWENALFYSGTYSGNPMLKHMGIHALSPFNKNHFSQWLFLFNETVDDLFKGPNADAIKSRAYNIATVMQIKILK